MRKAERFWSRRIRPVWSALRPRAVILLYHRVARLPIDPHLLAVTPDHFAEQLEILRRKCHPISLRELGSRLPSKIPDRAVVLTFDDGYADNLENAAPILSKTGIPATVFVSPGLAGTEAYHDALEHCLLRAPSLPRKLMLQIGEAKHAWDLGNIVPPADRTDAYWQWNSMQKDYPSPRHQAYNEIFRLLRPLGIQERTAALAQLRSFAGVEESACADHRYMTPEELRSLQADGLVGIGAHTMNHTVLRFRPLEEQFSEIEESRATLQRVTGRSVDTFAYPYGSAWDVSKETIALARKAKFSLACANEPGPVTAYSDPFWLPRCPVRDWTGEVFEEKLETYFRPVPVREPAEDAK